MTKLVHVMSITSSVSSLSAENIALFTEENFCKKTQQKALQLTSWHKYFLHIQSWISEYVILHFCKSNTHWNYDVRACLDQLLITIRSSLIDCDQVRSKTRLIAIIAKLEIIYTTWPHNGILSILSLPPPQSTYMYRPINTAPGEREDGG